MLKLNHLESVLAIHEHSNLRDAAQSIGVTQSALSHQIRDLEKQLQTTLLNRDRRPAQLTDAAYKLVELAESVLPQIYAVERQLLGQAAGNSGRLNIAIDCHSCFDWLMPALNQFRQKWRDVEMDLSSAFSFNPLPALKRGDLDLVITSDPDDSKDILYQPLFKYELVLAVANENPLAHKRFISPKDLASQHLITYPVDKDRIDIFTRFMRPAGVSPLSVRHTELTPVMIQMVSSNLGVAALPSWALHLQTQMQLISICHLGRAPGIWPTLYAAIRNTDSSIAYLQAFIRIAHDICFRNLTGIRKIED